MRIGAYSLHKKLYVYVCARAGMHVFPNLKTHQMHYMSHPVPAEIG